MVLTVQSVQADVAEPYDRTCGDMASICWLTVGRMGSRHVALFGASDWVPRGPIMGCHVAPRYWLFGLLSKCIGVRGVRPPDLPTA
jgi:hypothetical protein